MKKTIDEINEKILKGKAVVVTASEVKAMELSPEELAGKVDVVTTATFGPMCSSGMFINFGNSTPAIRMEEVRLNGVPVFAGLAAADGYIGATTEHPVKPHYGGAHVIETLVSGGKVLLRATGKGTDCYPRKEVEAWISRETVNEMYLFNPRNAYQNYCAATNSSSRMLHTYMGILLPHYGNLTYSTSGELNPLINDPYLRVIGPGTRIWLAGTTGYVACGGTQSNTRGGRNEYGVPLGNGASLALTAQAKNMDPRYLRAASFKNYGVSLFVGVGVPIPVLCPEIARNVQISNRNIHTEVLDYGSSGHIRVCSPTYEELLSGRLEIHGKSVPTAPLSSLAGARNIMNDLKQMIVRGRFLLSTPYTGLALNTEVKPLKPTGT